MNKVWLVTGSASGLGRNITADITAQNDERLRVTKRCNPRASRQDAIADAVTKVDQPALYSIYNAKNSTQKPIMLASGQNR
jgi:NAD(P)-dependent dehydrogenase (short-subunit alcohol dehydrogenase family)